MTNTTNIGANSPLAEGGGAQGSRRRGPIKTSSLASAQQYEDGAVFGPEAEGLLVDARTLVESPLAPKVIAVARQTRGLGSLQEIPGGPSSEIPGGPSKEVRPFMIEYSSMRPVPIQNLARTTAALRLLATFDAMNAGALPLFTGLPLNQGPEFGVSEGIRFEGFAQEQGAAIVLQQVCGSHLHASVQDPDVRARAAQLHIRWLPILLGASANSRIFNGQDMGLSAYRMIEWGKRLTPDLPPFFDNAKKAENAIKEALETALSIVNDPTKVHWAVRNKTNYASVEGRIRDPAYTALDEAMLTVLEAVMWKCDIEDAKRRKLEPKHIGVKQMHLNRAARDGRFACVPYMDEQGNEYSINEIMHKMMHGRIGQKLDEFGGRELMQDWINVVFGPSGSPEKGIGTGSERTLATLRRLSTLRDKYRRSSVEEVSRYRSKFSPRQRRELVLVTVLNNSRTELSPESEWTHQATLRDVTQALDEIQFGPTGRFAHINRDLCDLLNTHHKKMMSSVFDRGTMKILDSASRQGPHLSLGAA